MRKELSIVENGWPYANLTKTAKECGGVTEFMASVHDDAYDDGFKDGVKQTCIIVGAAAVISAVCCYGLKKYRDKKKLENQKKYATKFSNELNTQQIELDN